jgi:hypothetical protein
LLAVSKGLPESADTECAHQRQKQREADANFYPTAIPGHFYLKHLTQPS